MGEVLGALGKYYMLRILILCFSRAGFLFRSPKSRTSIEIFLKPLSTSIWLITGFFAIVSVVILKMVTTFEKKRYLSESESSWSLSVIFTIGAFCQQGIFYLFVVSRELNERLLQDRQMFQKWRVGELLRYQY